MRAASPLPVPVSPRSVSLGDLLEHVSGLFGSRAATEEALHTVFSHAVGGLIGKTSLCTGAASGAFQGEVKPGVVYGLF